jgi:hypothetical protein
MTPIVFNIACLNHKFYWANDCLGETWLKKYPGGAVASLGATNPSYAVVNHDYDKMLYKAIFNKEILPIGLVSNYAAAFVITKHGQYGETNVKMYCWFGDPAMAIKLNPLAEKPAYPKNVTLVVYPNPSGGQLTIRYFLPNSSKISLRIYDLTGRLVAVLKEEGEGKGYHQILWLGLDSQGRKVSSGIYFLLFQIIDDGAVKNLFQKKIIWLK